MGSDAQVYVFDDRRYRAQVVPALVGLVRDGMPGPWLTGFIQDTMRRLRIDVDTVWPGIARMLTEVGSADLVRYCTWLGADLRWAAPEPGYRVQERGKLTCVSTVCPERDRCVFHRERAAAEPVNTLFDALVTSLCVAEERSMFVGRTAQALSFGPVLDALGVAADDPVRALIAWLGSRGAVLGYTFGPSEGVHGWLTGAETAELAGRLDELPLPRYEPDFAVMRQLHGRNLRGEGPDWGELCLSFVRTVATISAAEGRGLLWGNDIGWDDWIDYFLVESEQAAD